LAVEFGGQDLLKDRWGIRRGNSSSMFGDLARGGAKSRCAELDGGDLNRARWPNHLLWEIACAEMNGDPTDAQRG
jgi:hypothetical protein